VVVSAPGVDALHPEKVTTMLERCWDARKHPPALDRAVSAVAQRFRNLCIGLAIPDMTDTVCKAIYNAVAVSLPHTLSRGEYLCALAFSGYASLSMVDAANLIAFYLESIGINAKVTVMSQARLQENVKSRNYDLALIGVNLSEVPNMSAIFGRGAKLNFNGFGNDNMELYLKQATAAGDEDIPVRIEAVSVPPRAVHHGDSAAADGDPGLFVRP
jgi:hypothetical protein